MLDKIMSRFRKIALTTIGAFGGGYTYYKISTSEKKFDVQNSKSICDFTPSVPWDYNWDCRGSEKLVPSEQNQHNEKTVNAKKVAARHIFLIRHGDYNKQDSDKGLTELGKKQAELVGRRLASMNIKWDVLVHSTMTRARETAILIAKHLPPDVTKWESPILSEGAPIPPEPPASSNWKVEPQDFFQDGVRIEAAFRRFFFRPPPDMTDDSYWLIVGHSNVFRFFICRVLQIPPEAWLRLSMNNCSITWVTIMPDGRIILRALNDTGHMDPKSFFDKFRVPCYPLEYSSPEIKEPDPDCCFCPE